MMAEVGMYRKLRHLDESLTIVCSELYSLRLLFLSGAAGNW